MREFRGNFSGFTCQVHRGSSFAVTSRDEVIAIIQLAKPRRRSLASPAPCGKIEMAPDSDVMPLEPLVTMESEGE